LADLASRERRPKYFRLDGKPLPALYAGGAVDLGRGFHELRAGADVCLVTTGYATHIGLRVAERMEEEGRRRIGLIDVFRLKAFDADALAAALSRYGRICTVEESFVRRGGLDNLILDLMTDRGIRARFGRYGPSDRYIFSNRDREGLHRAYGMDAGTIFADLLADLREELR
jgi:transketolase